MNFLAHAYLSFGKPEIMVGNFIADFVKGNKYLDYPDPIRQGILLHREIDQYTDQHDQVRAGKRRLYPQYRHYAGVIVDMYYDHFLAANFFMFHNTPLKLFTEQLYHTVRQHEPLPEKTERILFHMSNGNWLHGYAKIEGIEKALQGMSRRTRFDSGMDKAGQTLRSEYRNFYQDFMVFFPNVIRFARQKIETL
jgi:acyl carrier protein phosphodiesterase